MGPKKVHQVELKYKLGGVLARAVSMTNLCYVGLASYIIWRCSPNPILGVALAFFFTSISFQFFSLGSNLFGCIAMIVDYLLGTNLCLLITRTFFFLFKISGKLLHGYEIIGKENLPSNIGGLIVYQHNLLPYDLMYFLSELYIDHDTTVTSVMHRDLAMMSPGTCKVGHFTGEKEVLRERLKNGGLCNVSPGGGLEAVFSQNYELLWDGRIGFAALAKECGVPIIPMFTVNGHQSMPIKIPFFRDFFREVYQKTRHVILMPVALFPVKLRIHLGEPIFCGADETPAEFAKRAEAAIYNLRDKYQHPDSSTWTAFLERFGYRLPSASNHCAKQM